MKSGSDGSSNGRSIEIGVGNNTSTRSSIGSIGGNSREMSSSRETSSSFSHKVAYWTKKMGISSNGGGGGQHHQQNHHYQPRPDQQQMPSYPAGSGIGDSNAAAGQPYNNNQKHRPAVHKGPNPYRSSSSNNGHGRPSTAGAPYHHHGRTASRAGAAAAAASAASANNTGNIPPTNSLADAMDESEDLLYHSTQGMQKMNVDSRDETDHHTTATASTAAATHSYSIDDGSTGRVSESGTEVVHMPPRTIGASGYGPHGGAAARQSTPYNAHSFKAGNQTFTVDTKYSLIRVIGSGAYGVVISSLDSSTQTKVAIKMVPRAFHDEVDAKRILREIKLLKHFRHENIVGITDMMPPLARNVEDFHDVYICNELMETDLHRIIYSKQPLTIDHAQYFLYQILRALKYIHSANVLHRDLKPSNLLVNSNCDLKVCDFGLARGVLSDEEMAGKPRNALLLTEYVVTRWYRAPEIMLACHEYAKPVDVWSVGCIFAELLGRKPYFPGDDYIDQVSCSFVSFSAFLAMPFVLRMAFIVPSRHLYFSL